MEIPDLASYNDTYQKNRPFPHIQITSFLEEGAAEKLVAALEQEEFIEKEADLFHFLQTNDLNGSQQKVIQEFIVAVKNAISSFEKLTGTTLKKDILDIQGSVYADTHFLLCHDDQLEGRKVAFIYYLNDMKEEEEGGGLRLYYGKRNKDGKLEPIPDKFLTIRPQKNSIVIFTVSDRSFHEVEEVLVDKDRIAIGGWLHGTN